MAENKTVFGREVKDSLYEALQGTRTGDFNSIFALGTMSLNPGDFTVPEAEATLMTINATLADAEAGRIELDDTFAGTLRLSSQNITAYNETQGNTLNLGEAPAAAATEVDATPEPTQAPVSNSGDFWNVVANIQQEGIVDGDMFLYTHIVGDPRYVEYFDQYVEERGLSGPDVDALREKVVAAHESAAQTLETIEYDAIQMQYYGMTQDLYQAVEQGNFEILGEEYTAPSELNIFSGLDVSAPLDAAELNEVTVPLEGPRTATDGEVQPNANFTAAAAEPEMDTYTLQSGDILTKLMKEHYHIEDDGMAYRAALIVAEANSVENPDRVPPGMSIQLPPMEMLQAAAGTETLRLRNFDSHLDEVGANLKTAMSGEEPEAEATPPEAVPPETVANETTAVDAPSM